MAGIAKTVNFLIKNTDDYIRAYNRSNGTNITSILQTKVLKNVDFSSLNLKPILTDSFEAVKKHFDSPILQKIKAGFLVHAPESAQQRILKRLDDFITTDSDLKVVEKLYKAAVNEFKGMPEKNLIQRYNKTLKNLDILRKNNPTDYEIMVKGGFFDLVEQGKISLYNFETDFSNARISRSLLEDLRKAANGENFITKVDDLSFDEIKNLVKSGEVYSKNGRLFTHNHGLEHEIQLSEEKFLELFPPILRHISNQGQIGNCWIVGRLDNMISTQSGVSGIYSLFRQSGDDVFIKFANSDKEILFPKGQVLQTLNDKQMTTVPGLAMLEQALAVHLGGVYSVSNVTNINKFSKNPDELMNLLLGSDKRALMMRKKANNGEMLNIISGEHIDYIANEHPYNSYRAKSSISFWEKLSYALGKNKKTLSTNKTIMSQIINDQANAQNLKIGVGFAKDTPYEYRDLYNLVPNHQLTLKSVEGDTYWVSNPWFNWIEKGVDKNIFMKYLDHMQIPMQW